VHRPRRVAVHYLGDRDSEARDPRPRDRESALVEARAGTKGHLALLVPIAVATILLALLVSILTAPSATGAVNEDQPRSPFVAVGREVARAVVNIRTVRSITRGGVDTGPLAEMFRQFFPEGESGGGNRFENPGSGSGFVVSDLGEILTNHHVIANADAVFVRFSGETVEYPAEVTGTDPNTDLALLKIDAGERELHALEFADSDGVEVGDWAVAVGNPFGQLEGSLTVGVVSAKGRGDLVIQGLTPRYQDFLQTDASINFGNSGGPLVDIHGRVIGVNTAINAAGQGIGFAVPSNLVRRIHLQLREHGRVIRGYLGVTTEDLVVRSDRAQPGDVTAGARVLSVAPESPASAAGLQEGDVIVAFAGQEITSRRQLQFLVADTPLGEGQECVVVRGGKRTELEVRLVEFEETVRSREDREERWLGLEVASLASSEPRVQRLKEALGVTATSGVLVVAVIEDRPAAEAGIRPGDVLLAIDGQEILDLVGFERLRAQLAGRTEPMTALVRTGSVENYLRIQPREPGVEQ